MIFSERIREGQRLSDEHWNCFKGNVGETSERRGGVHIVFFQAHRYHLEPNWTGHSSLWTFFGSANKVAQSGSNSPHTPAVCITHPPRCPCAVPSESAAWFCTAHRGDTLPWRWSSPTWFWVRCFCWMLFQTLSLECLWRKQLIIIITLKYFLMATAPSKPLVSKHFYKFQSLKFQQQNEGKKERMERSDVSVNGNITPQDIQ